MRALTTILVVAVLAGCSGQDVPDQPADSETGSGDDATVDAGGDSGTDSSADTDTDADMDSDGDSDTDGDTDTDSDADTETETPGSETIQVDAGTTDTGSETETAGPNGCWWDEAVFGTTCTWGWFWADPGFPPPFAAAPRAQFYPTPATDWQSPTGHVAQGRCVAREKEQ